MREGHSEEGLERSLSSKENSLVPKFLSGEFVLYFTNIVPHLGNVVNGVMLPYFRQISGK